jgi:hypothetical protein
MGMKAVKFVGLILLAVVLGTGIAAYRIFDFENSPAFFKNGTWMGSNKLPLGTNPLVTAQITLFALYALPSEEAVYLFGRRDSEGNVLSGNKDYEITGNLNQLKAGYWSITAYGKDLFLIPNEAGRYSFNGNNVQADSAGNFRIVLSAKPQPGNWLPLAKGKRFNLLLRLYMGEQQFLDELNTTPLPVIKPLQP